MSTFAGTTAATDSMLSRPLISTTGVSRRMASPIWLPTLRTDFDLTGEHAELPEVVQGAGGSWNLFSVLGTPPALGRAFRPEEDKVGANHVVLLTWSFFQRRFAGDASVIGKQIRLNSTPYEIIGVMPRWFTYPDSRVQVWVPYASTFQRGGLCPA